MPKGQGRTRCGWATTPLSIAYHDEEWGVPVHDDRVLFEFITLEGAQAGLSWETILKKRDGYREAFADFDPAKVARFTPARVERLLQNPGIVRNRLKIESTVHERQGVSGGTTRVRELRRLCLELRGRSAARESPAHDQGRPRADSRIRRAQPGSSKRGFRFVGSTICYAFMQAVGLVDDHLSTAFGPQTRVMHGSWYMSVKRWRRPLTRRTRPARAAGSSRCRTRRPSAARAPDGRARRRTASDR